MSTLDDNALGPPGGAGEGKGSPEGAKYALFMQFYNVFTFSMYFALWLMDLELGGAQPQRR